MLDPGKMGIFMEYIEPAWLTKKRAQKSLQNAENKIKITLDEEEFTNRLEKRLNLIKDIVLESDTEDEADEGSHDHHSEQEFEDEAEDGACDYQEAWGQTWSSSEDEEELEYCDYPCRLCREVFVNLTEIQSHNLVHMVASPYHCNVCVFYSNEINILKMHMRGHREDNQDTWEQTNMPTYKKPWYKVEPRKLPPMRTARTLYTTELRVVPGKSKSCPPDAPHMATSEPRRISSIFEK